MENLQMKWKKRRITISQEWVTGMRGITHATYLHF